jgi:hypothetical protein
MQLCVNFILQQRCAGGSAAGADISFVYKDCLHPFPHQLMRDQGSRDPPANDGHFAGFIVLKRGVVGKKAVLQAPKRMSRS